MPNNSAAIPEGFEIEAPAAPAAPLPEAEPDENRARYVPIALRAADSFGIPRSLFLWQIGQESGFNPNARNPAPGTHATGIAQFQPATAREFNLDPTNPEDSLYAAARYMRELHDRTGNWTQALNHYGTVTADSPAHVKEAAARVTPEVPEGFQVESAIPEGFEIEKPADLPPPDAGARMQADVFGKIPHELRGYTPEELAQPTGSINPRTGHQYTTGEQLARVPILDAPTAGVQQIGRGVAQMAQPDDAEILRGAGKVVTGAVQTAAPAMAAAGVLAPLDAAAWYALSKGIGLGTEAGAKQLGANPEDAQEAGEVGSALPLAYGFGKILEGKLSDSIDAHNTRAAKLVEQDAQQGRGVDLGEHVAGPEIPLQGTEGLKVVPNGASPKGRPNYAVQDATGKPVYAGNGREVQQWLETKGVERTPATAPEPAPIVEQAEPEPTKPTKPQPVTPPPAAAEETPPIPKGFEVESQPEGAGQVSTSADSGPVPRHEPGSDIDKSKGPASDVQPEELAVTPPAQMAGDGIGPPAPNYPSPDQPLPPTDGKTVPEVGQPELHDSTTPDWFTPKTITQESGGPAIFREEDGKTIVRGLRFQKTPVVPEVNPDGATYFNVANPAAFADENVYSGETPAAGHWGGQHALTGEVQFDNPLMIPTEKAGQFNRPLPEQIIHELAVGKVKRYESFISSEVAFHKQGRTPPTRFDTKLENELGIPEGTITKARSGPPGSIENAIAVALLRKGGYDGAIGVPSHGNDFAEAVRLTPTEEEEDARRAAETESAGTGWVSRPRKASKPASSAKTAAPDLVPYNDTLPADRSGGYDDARRAAETTPGAVKYHPVGSWGVDLTGDLMQLREFDIDDPRLIFNEAEKRNKTVDKYADWIRAGHKPPPMSGIETKDGKVNILSGNHRRAAIRATGGDRVKVWVALPGRKAPPIASGSPAEPLPAEEEEQAETLGYDSKRGKVRVRIHSNPNGTFSASTEGEIRGFQGWMSPARGEHPTREAALQEAAAGIRHNITRTARAMAGSSATDKHVAEAKRILKWLTKQGESAPALEETAGTTPAPAETPTIEEQAHAENVPVRTPDSGALEEQLPEGSSGAGEERPARTPRRTRSGSRRGGGKPGALEGPGLQPGVRGEPSGVGSPAQPSAEVELTENLPPRGQAVASTRFDHDYRIPDGRQISGSPETRARANFAAVQLVRQLDEEDRPATVEEKETLAAYVGWGAVPQLFAGNTPEWKAEQDKLRKLLSPEEYEAAQASTLNAHYTGDEVVDAMWGALQHLGAKPGMSWLEPALGSGTFFGRQPAALLEGARRVAIEKDALTGRIAKYLYPDSGVQIKGFEEAELPENYFDGALSNVPFGKFGVHDPAYRNKPHLTASIHNYFFVKALDVLRPGGVLAFITSRYTMDGYEKGHEAVRAHLESKADFLGAVRLPSNAFMKSSGTHVITDIIFLRKRLPGAEPAGERWMKSVMRSVDYERIPINEYYHAHPENVLGTETLKRGQFSDHDYNVEGKLTPEALKEALEKALPADAWQEYKSAKKSRRVMLADLGGEEAKKIGGLFFDEKGQLYRKTSKGSAEPMDVPKPELARIRGQLKIRNVLRQLLDAEREDTPEPVLNSMRQALNRAYDDYVKQHGVLSTRANVKALYGDPDAPLLVNLERRYDGKQSADKAPIFTKRQLSVRKPVTSAADASEALIVSLNETGRVDWERMEALTGQTPGQMQKELSEAGRIFLDPESRTWQTAEEYLSGAVRGKLKAAEAVAQLEAEHDFARNVEALKKVQPEDIPPEEISVGLGVNWVPRDVYGEFVQHILGTPNPAVIKYAGERWFIEARTKPNRWDTAKRSALDLLQDSMNLQRTRIYDRVKDKDVLNHPETLAAQARQKELQEEFQTWMWGEAKRRKEVARIYNDLQNDLVKRTYDGSHLTLPEMSRAALRSGNLDPHQLAAVWRQICQRNVLLAHWVGTGKTFEMIAGGMELQRMGLIKRPMYVVPNTTLGGWQMQFQTLYPQKRVLVFQPEDLKPAKRKALMALIATSEWDAVVIPESSFGLLRTGDEIFEEHFRQLEARLEEQLEEAESEGIDTRQIKRMEAAKERLLTSLRDKRNAARQDDTVSFEQLGIDQLYVDEAHHFKKLGFTTKQQNTPGIDQGSNQRTFDLLMKMRHVQKHGRGVTFATATPVTNTMGELFNVMRYLIEPEMQARGMGKFDEWSASYARTVENFERKIEGGGYHKKARFSEFVNIQELQLLFSTFADVVTAADAKVPTPAVAGGKRQAVEGLMNDDQHDYLERLMARGGRIRESPHDALPDNLLAVFTDATKMALDIRMVVPTAKDHPGSRLNLAADNLWKFYKESNATLGTQLVFAEIGKPDSEKDAAHKGEFSAYDELIRKLVERGIPRSEIAHIYEAKGKVARAQLFAKVNAGKIRVLLGTTGAMGEGVNVQERVYAMHHLDVPHRPTDLDQREGRGLRQGNIHPEVHILYYLTKGTLDESKFQNAARKANFITAFLSGKFTGRRMEDITDLAPTLEMMQALSSDNPLLVRKIEVDQELDRLDSMRYAFRQQQSKRRDELENIPLAIAAAKGHIRHYTRVIETREKTGRVWVIGKQRFEGEGIQNKIADALNAAVAEAVKGDEKKIVWRRLGSAYGIELEIGNVPEKKQDRGPEAVIRAGLDGWEVAKIWVAPGEALGAVMKLSNAFKGYEARREDEEGKIRSWQAQEKTILEQGGLGQKWRYEEQYQKLSEEQHEIFVKLGGESSEVGPDDITDASVEAENEPEAEEPEEAAPAAPSNKIDTPDEDEDSGVILGSGFGAMQPYLRRFLKNDVIPTLKQTAELAKLAKQDILKLAAPAAIRGAQPAALSTRANAAELARSTDRAKAALAVARKYFASRPRDENYEFIDRVEHGQKQPSPELQAIADVMRPMLDTRRDEIRALGSGKLENFIEDYFPHIWKNVNQARQAFADRGRRPLEGSKSFLKKRSIESFADGIAMGLEPFSTNPVDLVLAKAREMDKYLAAHHILDDLRAQGLLQFLRATRPLPEDWAKINDPAAIVHGTPSHEGARQIEGYWIAPEPAARILNNYLSPGLREKSALFRSYLSLANVVNQAQLSLSAFHLGFTTIDVATSKLALALYQGGHGDIGKALLSVAKVPFSPFTNVMRGDKMLKEWYAPGTQGALIGELVDAAVKAGGRARMDDFYQTRIAERMMDAFRAGNVLGAVARLPGAAIEAAAWPIMQYIVPRQKMGVFADLAQYELERLGTNATDPEVQAALARAWDSVDNRLGQLVYDNLFWHKVVKDLSMASVRSVGWNVGTVRELAGGLSDAAKAAGGKGGVTPRMSYAIALPLLVGLIGALAYYLWHGHAPKHLKDYYFPTDAHGHRWSLPTYMKDVYEYGTNPVRTIQGKVHPLLATLWEMLANKDFYDKPIRNPHHKLVKQAEELAVFAPKQFVPLAYRTKPHHKVTLEERALSFIGVRPAPKSLDKGSSSGSVHLHR